MKAEEIKWCPQHGYPLPCNKCGMPLSQPQQKEIYESGRREGKEEFDKEFKVSEQLEHMQLIEGVPAWICIDWEKWQSKLKEEKK